MLNQKDRMLYRRLISYVAPQRKALLCLLLGTIFYGLTEPLVPMILKPMLDNGFAGKNMQTIYAMTTLLVVGFIVRGIANFTADYSMAVLAQNVVLNLRKQMISKLVRLPMSYFQKHANGEIISRFTYDVLQLMSASTDALAIVVREVVTIVALLAYLLWLDYQLTLMIFTLAPLIAFVIVFISKRLRRLAHALQTNMSNINHRLAETLRGNAIIKMYNAQNFEKMRFDAEVDEVCRHLLQSGKISSAISPIIEFIIISALAAVILLAARQNEAMSAGTFVAFLGTMALLFPPIKRLGKVSEPIQRGLAAMYSVFTFLDEEEETADLFPPFSIQKGDISLQNLSFATADKVILENINLDIKAGETIALVGESGSGKTTLASIIAGFYLQTNGELFFDGKNAREINLSDRRAAIAYVSQETILFTGTSRDNIAYGSQYVDLERLKNAANSAYAEDFINELPHKFESELGENGSRLSGGQRQRIAIARAIYKNAPILILDEATSALDNQSECLVQKALDTLQKKRTSIVIAHRLSTIKNADRIVVLSHGKIVEIGSHEELMNKNGIYTALHLQGNV